VADTWAMPCGKMLPLESTAKREHVRTCMECRRHIVEGLDTREIRSLWATRLHNGLVSVSDVDTINALCDAVDFSRASHSVSTQEER